jgi:hypothetical protein
VRRGIGIPWDWAEAGRGLLCAVPGGVILLAVDVSWAWGSRLPRFRWCCWASRPSPGSGCAWDWSGWGLRSAMAWVGPRPVAPGRRGRPDANPVLTGVVRCDLVVRSPDVAPARPRLGFRSRPVADASGAPVLRDHGPIGRPGTVRPMQASVRPHPYQGSARGLVSAGSRLRPVRATYRWRPLVTARDRSAPMACGPNVDQPTTPRRALGQSGRARPSASSWSTIAVSSGGVMMRGWSMTADRTWRLQASAA